VLSVPPEAAANAAFQAAPSWLTRPDASPANDIFGSLVHQNTPAERPASAAPPPPAPPPSQAAPQPRADHAPAANKDTSAAPANSDASSTGAGSSSSSSTDANSGATSANANSQSGGGTSQPATTSSSTTAKSTGQKPQDAHEPQANADTTVTDPTALVVQQVGLLATTPTPVAVAIAVATPPTNSPPAPSSGGPTAPLAIAAAAIAASSQALAAAPGTPVQVKSSDASAASVSGTATGNAAPSAPAQSNGADPSAVTAAALAGTVAASAPVAPKAQGKTAAATPASGSATTDTAAVDPASTAATTGTGQNAAAPQVLTGLKSEASAPAAEGTAGAANDAATPTQAVSAREHAATAATSAHVANDLPDPGAQAVFTVQPQSNSASSLAQANNLTVTAPTNATVPLSGVALQIAVNVKSGKSSFEIRLEPADLGRIDVRVQIDQNGQVTSHLTVEKPETLSMLQQNAPQLQQALDDTGLKTGSGGLQFSLRDQSSYGQNSGGESNPNARQLIISDEDAVPAALAGRSYGRSLGSSGGVDIRV
jgi:flagellar hook-length control protein FliK